MSAPSIRKFGFETEFAPDGEILREGPGRPRLMSPADIEALRAGAYQEGKRDALARAEAETAAALSDLAKAAGAVLKRLDGESRAMREEAARIALIAARKIAGAALDAYGADRAAAAIEAALDALRHHPRLIVRLAPATADALRERIESMCAAHAYAGAVIVRADAAMSAGQIAIDWSDGVVGLDAGAIAARVETLIEDNLAKAAGQ